MERRAAAPLLSLASNAVSSTPPLLCNQAPAAVRAQHCAFGTKQ
jgi:hypothetical protein